MNKRGREGEVERNNEGEARVNSEARGRKETMNETVRKARKWRAYV